MDKILMLLKYIGLYRSKPDAQDDISLFDRRLKMVSRAREYNAATRGPGFRNPPSQSKA